MGVIRWASNNPKRRAPLWEQVSQLPHLIAIWLWILYKPPPFRPSGLPFAAVFRYTRRLSKVRQRVLPAMEINPILNTIKDLSERSETIRGYL